MLPRDARTIYLNGKPPDKAAEIVLKADRIGPTANDADWVVALAVEEAAKRIKTEADEAAKRIEAAAAKVEAIATDASVGPRLDRIETKLRTVYAVKSAYGFLTYAGCFVAGGAIVLLLLSILQGARVPGFAILISAGIVGAALFMVALGFSAKLQEVLEERRYHR